MRAKSKIIGLGILVGMMLWLVDGLLDLFLFDESRLWGFLLTSIPDHELYFRSISLLLFIGLGGIIFSFAARHRWPEEESDDLENDHRAMAWNFPGLVYRVHLKEDNRVEFFNHMLRTMTGFELRELQGNGICFVKPLILPEDVAGVVDVVENALKMNTSFEVEYRVNTKNEDIKHFLERGRPVYDIDGMPLYLDSVIIDITDRKRAEETIQKEKDRVQNFLDLAGVIFVAIDNQGRVTLINKRGCEILGYPEPEVVGKNWFDNFVPERLKAEVKEISEKSMAGEVEPTEYHENPILTKGGEERVIAWHNSVMRDEHGAIVGHLSSGVDITERQRTEKKLKDSEGRYRVLFEGCSEGILVAEVETKRHLYANPALRKMLGYSEEEIARMSLPDLHPRESLDFVLSEFEAQARGEKTLVFDIPCLRKDGSILYADVNTTRVMLDNKPCSVGFFTDVTQRRRAQEEIRKFKTISDTASYGSAIADLEGHIIYINDVFAGMHGFDKEELIGKNLTVFHSPEQLARVQELNTRLKNGGSYIAEEVWHQRKDGTVFPTLMNAAMIMDDRGNPCYLSATAVDISDRKQAEDALRASLQEKEMLLREVHHRVKNNLQVISSLVNFQARFPQHKDQAASFNDLQNRIKAMSLIHEKLYKTEDLTRIDLNDYMRDLVNSLYRTYGVGKDEIVLETEIEDVSLGIDEAIPCGLIINELVSNSLKHAFPDGKKGAITVAVRPSDNGEIELMIRDDGVGLPEGVDFRQSESLGLQLVSILAEDQLHGKIELDRSNGTEFRITLHVGGRGENGESESVQWGTKNAELKEKSDAI